jgi:hypothetical protein
MSIVLPKGLAASAVFPVSETLRLSGSQEPQSSKKPNPALPAESVDQFDVEAASRRHFTLPHGEVNSPLHRPN